MGMSCSGIAARGYVARARILGAWDARQSEVACLGERHAGSLSVRLWIFAEVLSLGQMFCAAHKASSSPPNALMTTHGSLGPANLLDLVIARSFGALRTRRTTSPVACADGKAGWDQLNTSSDQLRAPSLE